MNSKGFTFAQIAALILVIMGLTVAVVLAATQLSSLGSNLSQLGDQSGTGVEAAASASASLGTQCIADGGFCTANACDASDTNPRAEPYLYVDDVDKGKDCAASTPNCCKSG